MNFAGGLNWIHLSQGGDTLWPVVNAFVNYRFTRRAVNLLQGNLSRFNENGILFAISGFTDIY